MFPCLCYISPLVLLVLMMIGFTLTTRSFLTVSNLTSVVQNNSVIAMLGIALTLVILLGEIDLAFPGIVLMSAASTGLFFAGTAVGIPILGDMSLGGGPVVQALVVVALGLLLGLLTGFLVGRMRVPSLIASLGVLLFAQGWAFYWLHGKAAFDLPTWVISLGKSKTLGVPHIVICAAAIAIVIHLMLTRTIIGRYIFMSGANRNAANLSGIDTKRLLLFVFSLAGLIAAIAGIAYAGNYGSVSAQSGGELLLPTFAAVVLGGTSLLGGAGGVKNTIIGVLIFAVLDNGLLLLNIDVFIRPLMQGVVLIVAVVLNVALSKLADYANGRSALQRSQT